MGVFVVVVFVVVVVVVVVVEVVEVLEVVVVVVAVVLMVVYPHHTATLNNHKTTLKQPDSESQLRCFDSSH